MAVLTANRGTGAALLLAAGALSGACEVERTEGRFPALDAAAGGEDAGPGALGDAGGAGGPLTDATGQWLLFVQDRKCLFAVGQAVEHLIWSWYLVDVEDPASPLTGPRYLRQTGRLCAQTLSPVVGGLQTVVPAELPARLPTWRAAATLVGTAPGSAYVAEEVVDLWGAAEPDVEAPLPTEAGDPRVADTDADGHPGVTLAISNRLGDPLCEIRLVQRTRLRLAGTVVDAVRLEGSVWSLVEKQILDATSPLCRSPNELTESPRGSSFVLLRLRGAGLALDRDGDGRVDCPEVIAAKDVLLRAGWIEEAEPDGTACMP